MTDSTLKWVVTAITALGALAILGNIALAVTGHVTTETLVPLISVATTAIGGLGGIAMPRGGGTGPRGGAGE